MGNAIRIGTRNSRLACWQAEEVARQLISCGRQCITTGITSDGDINTEIPLYETGIQGIFTKALDVALLENRIDIAVHSYKDVPTTLAKGVQVAAVLKRGNPHDVLVCNTLHIEEKLQEGAPVTIATSSVRRSAQWLYKYKNSQIVNIRGNVPTRLQKLKSSGWHGAIFAAAGLERLGIAESYSGKQLKLEWMLPAPAQGAIVVLCREDDKDMMAACACMDHEPTRICTAAERDFLRLMQGGCSTPVSAYAFIEEGVMCFTGNITAPDGSESISVSLQEKSGNPSVAAKAIHKISVHPLFSKYAIG